MKTIIILSTLIVAATVSSTAVAEQVCNYSTVQLATNDRFEVLGYSVKDKRTGLTWKRCSEGQTWNDSSNSCDGELTQRNWLEASQQVPDGWRLPNIKELVSIMEYGCANPAINLSVFPATPVGTYWSSTAATRSPLRRVDNSTWSLSTQDGTTDQRFRSTELYVRLVKVDTAE